MATSLAYSAPAAITRASGVTRIINGEQFDGLCWALEETVRCLIVHTDARAVQRQAPGRTVLCQAQAALAAVAHLR